MLLLLFSALSSFLSNFLDLEEEPSVDLIDALSQECPSQCWADPNRQKQGALYQSPLALALVAARKQQQYLVHRQARPDQKVSIVYPEVIFSDRPRPGPQVEGPDRMRHLIDEPVPAHHRVQETAMPVPDHPADASLVELIDQYRLDLDLSHQSAHPGFPSDVRVETHPFQMTADQAQDGRLSARQGLRLIDFRDQGQTIVALH